MPIFLNYQNYSLTLVFTGPVLSTCMKYLLTSDWICGPVVNTYTILPEPIETDKRFLEPDLFNRGII